MITNLQIGYNGRLGNQLFQYAACYSTAKRLGVEFFIPSKNVYEIKPDGCFDYSNNKWIEYQFRMYDCFNLTAQIKNENVNHTYKEPHFHFDSNFLNIKDSTSVEGYFQSEKYFELYKDEIINEFQFKEEIKNLAKRYFENFKDKEVITIHIRRGDNVINPVFPTISMEYIQTAINEFTDKEYNYLIISDDILYCKQLFPNSDNIRFSTGENDFVDMCLMRMADHNIISNSSFSW